MKTVITAGLSTLMMTGLLCVGTVATEPVAVAGEHHSGDYGTTYETKNGSYVVRAITGGYEWEAANGESGQTRSKKKARKNAKASLADKPAK